MEELWYVHKNNDYLLTIVLKYLVFLHLQFDVGIQRYMSLKATQHQFFRPNPKTSMLGILLIVIPYCSLTYFIKKERVCIQI